MTDLNQIRNAEQEFLSKVRATNEKMLSGLCAEFGRPPEMVTLMAYVALTVETVNGAANKSRQSLRTKTGMERARKEGKHPGRPRARFDHELARRMVGAGHSRAEIAKTCNVSKATIVRFLRDD